MNRTYFIILILLLSTAYIFYQIGVSQTLAKFPLRSPCHLTYKTENNGTLDHFYILTHDECDDLLQYAKYFQNDTALRVQKLYTSNHSQPIPPPPYYQPPQTIYTHCTSGPLGIQCYSF